MSDTVGGLPEYRATVQQRVVGAPAEARIGDLGAGGLISLSRSLANVGDMFGRQAEQQQFDRGRAAGAVVERDPATGLPVPPTLREDGTPFGRAFDAAARVAYLDTLKQDSATEFTRLAAQHRATPEAFLPLARERISTVAGQAPDAFRGEITRELDGIAQGMARSLISQWAGVQSQQQRAAWERQGSNYAEEMRLLMLNGEPASGAPAAQSLARLQEHFDRGVIAGHISIEQRDLFVEEALANGAVASIAGEAGRIALTRGPEAAQAWANEQLARPEIAAAGNQFVREMRAEVGRQIYEARIGRGEARDTVRADIRALEASASAGVAVPAATWQATAQRAEAAGLPQQAAEARAMATVSSEVTALAGAGLPQLIQSQFEAQAGDPTDPASAIRARMIGRMVQQRADALRTDPAGWARTQPAVQRAASGGNMADVIRAQDAVLAENGVPPEFRRIVPQSDVNAIKALVDRGDAQATMAGLRTMFEGYGAENRWRVWNDLRAGGVPASVRPAALLMASGQSGALQTYLNASAQGEENLTRAIGDDAQAVRDRIMSNGTMTEFRRTASGFGYDAALMTDTDSAVRTLAMWHARSMSPSQAVELAVSQVIEPLGTIVQDSRASFRIPAGTDIDARQFRTLLYQAASPVALSRLRFDLSNSGISADVPADRRQESYRRALASGGTWRTGQDGQGVWLHDQLGRPVFTEDGRPVGVRFEEARNATVGNLPIFQPPRTTSESQSLNQEFARRRQAVMDDPNLTASQRDAALARISEQATAAIGQRTNNPARPQPGSVPGVPGRWDEGLRPPSGRVANTE